MILSYMASSCFNMSPYEPISDPVEQYGISNMYPFHTKFHGFCKLKRSQTNYLVFKLLDNGSLILAGIWPVGHACAVPARHSGGASAHCRKGMTNWPNTIQCLGSDDIMSFGIKSSATEGVGSKKWFQGFGFRFLTCFPLLR